MKLKKGQLFEIPLVLLTIFMCLLVIGFYYFQQKQVGNAVILPNALLSLENNKEIFEFQENNIITQTARELLESSSYSDDDFQVNFENKFFDSLIKDEQEQFRNFLFTDAMLDRKEIIKDNLKDKDSEINFFREVYSIKVEDGILNVTRKPITKFLALKPDAKNKISFNIRVNYDIEKEYLIDLNKVQEG